MTSRLSRVIVLPFLLLTAAVPLAGQAPAATPDVALQIKHLADLDRTARVTAARQVRRGAAAVAVPALTQAIRDSPDQFVRCRALVLLIGFNDSGTPALVKGLLADRNDRVREIAYRWVERHPDPSLTPVLLAALETEQAEFVRPALIKALAALSGDPLVQRALIAESQRGLDFFRSAVIDALGQTRGSWATSSLLALLQLNGPLLDDAVLALGRRGDRETLPAITSLAATSADVTLAVLAARCLLGEDCAMRIAAIREAVVSRVAANDAIRAGVADLSLLALTSDDALATLASLLANAPVRDDVVVGIGGVALRAPDRMLKWLDVTRGADRDRAIGALHEAFDRLEEDFAEEEFFAAARTSYWAAPDGSSTRTLMAMLIDTLEF